MLDHSVLGAHSARWPPQIKWTSHHQPPTPDAKEKREDASWWMNVDLGDKMFYCVEFIAAFKLNCWNKIIMGRDVSHFTTLTAPPLHGLRKNTVQSSPFQLD